MAAGTDPSGRTETEIERLDRNWVELLQEIRVIQTGVQLLTGFLLTLPFQQRFETLSRLERDVFLATAAAAVTATAFLQAPVIMHRALFRQHRRKETVQFAHRLAIVGIGLLGLVIVGISFLIPSVVLGSGYGAGAAAFAAVVLLALWVALPIGARLRSRPG